MGMGQPLEIDISDGIINANQQQPVIEQEINPNISKQDVRSFEDETTVIMTPPKKKIFSHPVISQQQALPKQQQQLPKHDRFGRHNNHMNNGQRGQRGRRGQSHFHHQQQPNHHSQGQPVVTHRYRPKNEQIQSNTASFSENTIKSPKPVKILKRPKSKESATTIVSPKPKKNENKMNNNNKKIKR